jgi:hypothetical protein
MAAGYDFDSGEFDQAVATACHNAFQEALSRGLPVFYTDRDGLNVMECSGGRRFEIRWRQALTSGENFEIVRELASRAA